MRINANQIEEYLNAIASKTNCVLLYGPDYGLINIRLESIKKQIFPDKIDQFRYFEFNNDELKENNHKLFQAINSVSFFSGKKLIVIKDIPATMPSFIKEALETLSNNELVILLGDDLSPTNSSRKFIEDSKNFIAIPCYKDEPETVKRNIFTFFRTNNIKIEQQALEYLETSISSNRLIMQNELNKILDYYDGTPLTLENIINLTSSELETAVENFIFQLFLGNLEFANKFYKQTIEMESPISVIRFMLNHSFRLLEVKSKMQDGINVFDAMKTLRPPVFFKHQKIFAEQINKLSIEKINHIVKTLLEAEMLFKSDKNLDVIIKEKLLSVAV